MLEIISRIGIPSEILTDQGMVFVGKLTSQLCGRLGRGRPRLKPCHTSPKQMVLWNIGMGHSNACSGNVKIGSGNGIAH